MIGMGSFSLSDSGEAEDGTTAGGVLAGIEDVPALVTDFFRR
jgi:hypothetical protein